MNFKIESLEFPELNFHANFFPEVLLGSKVRSHSGWEQRIIITKSG